MKTLLNNFTTPKQSKRLLELGVPVDSADCYYYEEGGIADDATPDVVPFGEKYEDASMETVFSSYASLPCWSVGRLIEIVLLCNTSNGYGIMFDKSLYENAYCTNIQWCIRVLESRLRCGHLDFSRLEK